MTVFKKIGTFLVTAMLALTAFFAVGCGADNNGKCETHTYGAWEYVKDPTETEKGERKRTCLVCGDEESEEISALSAVSAAVQTPEFAQKGSGVNIEIEPFEFVQTSIDRVYTASSVEPVIESVSYTTYSVKGGYAYIGINDEGFIYAYGSIALHVSEEVRNLSTNEVSNEDSGLGIMEFMLEKDVLNAAVTVYDKDEATGEYTVLNKKDSQITTVNFTEIAQGQSGWAKTALELIFGKTDKLIDFVNTDLRPFAEEISAAFGLNSEESQKRMLGMMFSEAKLSEGYLLELKPNYYEKCGKDISELKVNELIDKYCGAGTFAAAEAGIPALLDMKVSNVLGLLAGKGITVEKVETLVNKALKLAMGDDATLKNLTGKSISEMLEPYKDKTIEEVINEVINAVKGEPAGDNPADNEPVQGEPVQGEESYLDLKTSIAGMLDMMKECTLPELVAMVSDNKVPAETINAMISSMMPEFDKMISLRISLDGNRTITGYSISLSKNQIGVMLSMLTGDSPYSEASSSAIDNTPAEGFVFKNDVKVSVSFGKENASNKDKFGAEEFLKKFAEKAA